MARSTWVLRFAVLAVLAAMPLPAPAGAPDASGADHAGATAAASPAPMTISVVGNGRTRSVSLAEIEALPAVTMKVSFKTEKGRRSATFKGPLLWTVLQRLGVFEASTPRDRVHQVLRVTGADGYTAALALGELDPAFEGKRVILATAQDGTSLGAGHLRLVVPGDRHGGRSVREVVRLAVE